MQLQCQQDRPNCLYVSHFCYHLADSGTLKKPETWLFHPSWWRNAFKADGFEIVRDFSMGHVYTGNMLLGSRISMASRGEACKSPRQRLSPVSRSPDRPSSWTTNHPSDRI
jgi:hypothetical protein